MSTEKQTIIKRRKYNRLLSKALCFLCKGGTWEFQEVKRKSLKNKHHILYVSVARTPTCPAAPVLYFTSRICSWKMTMWNKDCISHPLLHLNLAMWPPPGQQAVRESDTCNFCKISPGKKHDFLSLLFFLLDGMWMQTWEWKMERTRIQ